MSLDPQSQTVLATMAQMHLPAFQDLSIAAARALFDGLSGTTASTEAVEMHDTSIPGVDGAIPVRIYSPTSKSSAGALIYFHGGGWVLGNLNTHDQICRRIAASGTLVISVDYRLAPETCFPGPVEDCYFATKWLAENGQRLGFDPTRLAVGGDSAGGNLAAVVAQMARDRSGPELRLQILLCPITDCEMSSASYVDYADGYFLTRSTMDWFWQQYSSNLAERSSPYASPLRASDLSGLPPAIIITAEYDPLRDQGEAYAHALEHAGVDTTLTRYDGVFHGFFGFSSTIDKGSQALEQVGAALAHHLR